MVAILDQPRPLYAGLRISPDAYFSLEDDGFKYDMIDGVLHLPPSGTPEHSHKQAGFTIELGVYLRVHPVGRVYTEADIKLPDGGDVLRPDVCYVANERAHIVTEKGIYGAPDLVCEVLSKSTRDRDLGNKSERYLKNGVAEYWIVDPDRRSMKVHYNNDTAWKISRGATLRSRLLSGFVVRKRDLFGPA